MHAQPAVLLMGPTGAGKTELAANLVAELPIEIVSVDCGDGVSRHGHRHGQAGS